MEAELVVLAELPSNPPCMEGMTACCVCCVSCGTHTLLGEGEGVVGLTLLGEGVEGGGTDTAG